MYSYRQINSNEKPIIFFERNLFKNKITNNVIIIQYNNTFAVDNNWYNVYIKIENWQIICKKNSISINKYVWENNKALRIKNTGFDLICWFKFVKKILSNNN